MAKSTFILEMEAKGYISASIAHKMLLPYARNHEHFEELIKQLRSAVHYEINGTGKRARRWYVKAGVKAFLHFLPIPKNRKKWY